MDRRINFDLFDAEVQFSHLSQAFEAGLEGIEHASRANEQFIQMILDGYPEAERLAYREHLESEQDDEQYRLRQAHYAAFLTSLYALFEFSILKIGENYLFAIGSRLRVRDLSGSSIEKIETIVNRIFARGSLPNDVLQEVVDVRALRNLFIHGNGWISNADEFGRLSKLVRRWPNVHIQQLDDPEGWIVRLEDDFLRHIAKLFVKLLRITHTLLESEVSNANS